jgi:alkylation response protein AidB-like acyl-CoA dehydrogenase
MTQIDLAWGAGPSARYEEIAARFRPIFAEIAKGAIERELTRKLPTDEIVKLKQAGLGALRVPEAEGGFGATLPELANILIELSEADSNITQALRGHFGFVEDVARAASGGRSASRAARSPATPGRKSAMRSRTRSRRGFRREMADSSSTALNITRPARYTPTGSMSAPPASKARGSLSRSAAIIRASMSSTTGTASARC